MVRILVTGTGAGVEYGVGLMGNDGFRAEPVDQGGDQPGDRPAGGGDVNPADPGLDRVRGVLRAHLRHAVGLVDEFIRAHALRTRSDNAWQAAQDGLVLYTQNARPMLVNAAWLTLFVWLLSFLVFLVTRATATLVAWALPGEGSGAMVVFAVVFAWALKAALIEPFAVACMLQVFFKVTAGRTLKPEWSDRLSKASGKFRELGEKAVNWTMGRAGGVAPAPVSGQASVP